MRQFIIDKQKIKNNLILLNGKDYKYLRSVLRVKVGDMINVRLPNGVLENATVAKINDKESIITLQLCAQTVNTNGTITRGVQADEIEKGQNNEERIEYYLFQFLPKPQKFELIVRQATECGISYIVPVIGEYTEKSSVMSLNGNKKERIERIVREARQQSGSPIDTKVLEPMKIEDAIKIWNEGFLDNEENPINEIEESQRLAFVLSERDDCSDNLRNVVNDSKAKDKKIKRVGIACGSEGGLSPEEVSYLQEKGLFYPIHFAVNILRCETASLYGIASVQSFIN